MTTTMTSALVGRFRRTKWDSQPTQPASVLLASAGGPFPPDAVDRAVELARGYRSGVAVVTIARLYGSAFGLPNPGLMPTKQEMALQRSQVDRALARIAGSGLESWGQVATTRHPSRSISRVAQARGSTHIVVLVPEVPRWRQVVEGDLVRAIQRRVGSDVVVEGVPAG